MADHDAHTDADMLAHLSAAFEYAPGALHPEHNTMHTLSALRLTAAQQSLTEKAWQFDASLIADRTMSARHSQQATPSGQ